MDPDCMFFELMLQAIFTFGNKLSLYIWIVPQNGNNIQTLRKECDPFKCGVCLDFLLCAIIFIIVVVVVVAAFWFVYFKLQFESPLYIQSELFTEYNRKKCQKIKWKTFVNSTRYFYHIYLHYRFKYIFYLFFLHLHVAYDAFFELTMFLNWKWWYFDEIEIFGAK